MSQATLRDLTAEAVNIDGTGPGIFRGALRGERSFAEAFAGVMPISGVNIKIEELNEQGYLVRWEQSLCTVTSTGFTRDTCILSSNNGAFVEFAAGYKRAFVFIPVVDVGGGAATGALRYDVAQSLSSGERAQLQQNGGLASQAGLTDEAITRSSDIAQVSSQLNSKVSTSALDAEITARINFDTTEAVSRANGDAALQSSKAPIAHTHTPAQIVGLSGYIESQIDDYGVATTSELTLGLATKAPTSHTHPLSDLTASGATISQVPTWNGAAWVPATPSGGSTAISRWVRGVGMYQDYAGTVPVTAAGQYCRAWRADDGSMLVSQEPGGNNVHVAALFEGVLTPFSRPASNAYWATTASYVGNAYEYSIALSHSQPGIGLCICQPAGNSGLTIWGENEISISAPSTGLYSPTRTTYPISSNVSVIGYRATASAQTVWIDGEQLAPYPAPAAENAPVRIGRLTDNLGGFRQDGFFILGFAIASIFGDSERTKIHGEHRAFIGDISARKAIYLAGDSTSSVAGSLPFDPGFSLAYLLGRKYRLHHSNISGASFSAMTSANSAIYAQITRDRTGPVDAVIWNTNDYDSGGGTAVGNAIVAFAAAQKAAGYFDRVFWCRTFTRPGAGSAGFQAEVDAAHAIISTNANITGVIDLRAIEVSGDNIHPTVVGVRQAYKIISEQLANAARKYFTPAPLGDGSTLNFLLTHNLNNRLAHIDLIDEIDVSNFWVAPVSARTENTITLTFTTAPAIGQFTASVIG